MDKPKCKVCGKKHWTHEDHVWPEKRSPPKVVYPEITDEGVVLHDKPKFLKKVNREFTGNIRQNALKDAAPVSGGRDAQKKFDRVAYQREYMRKWRKKNG